MRATPSMTALFLAACGGPSPTGANPAAAVEAATALCASFTAAGSPCQASGAAMAFDGRAVEVQATLDSLVPVGTDVVLALRLDLSVDGQAQPHLGTVTSTTGAGREQAISNAVREWSIQYGVAIVDGLRDTGRSAARASITTAGFAPGVKSALEVGDWRAYPGVGLRKGDVRDGGVIDPQALLVHLRGVVSGLDPAASPHALTVVMTLGSDGRVTPECRVDGELSAELGGAAKGYAWPKANPQYLARQHYVLTPKPQ